MAKRTKKSVALDILARRRARALVKLAVGEEPSKNPFGGAQPANANKNPFGGPAYSGGNKNPFGGAKPGLQSAPAANLPQNPANSWGSYLTDTNNGLMKDVGDYFPTFVAQNTLPFTEAWKTAPERYKNLPVDRALGQAATAGAGTAALAGGAAATLPVVAPTIAGMSASALPAGAASAAGAVADTARRFAAPVTNAYARVPESVKQIGSYVTGLPLSKNISTGALVASDLAQSAGYAYLSGVDQANEAVGQPTNWRAALPMPYLFDQAAASGIQSVFGDQAQASDPPQIDPTAEYGAEGGNIGPSEVRQPSGYDNAVYEADQQYPSYPFVVPPEKPTEVAENSGGGQFSVPPEEPSAPTSQAQNEYGVPGGQIGPPEFKLPPDTPPEVKAQVDAGVKQVQELPEEQRATAAAAVKDPEGPEATTLKQDGLKNIVNEAASDPNNPPPQDPDQYGQWLGGVVDNFLKLDPMSQIAMGLSLNIGLLGLISSLSGEGGVGSFLMSALGLGALGVGAAGSGMLGDDAQAAVGSMAGGLLGGAMPEGKQDLSALMSNDPVSAALASSNAGGNIQGQLDKVEKLKQLAKLPAIVAMPLLRQVDPENIRTTEDARRAYDNAQKLVSEINNPESALAQRIATGRQAVDTYNNAVDTGVQLYGGASNALSNAGQYIMDGIKSWAG